MARSASGDSACRVAGVHEPFHGIAASVTAVGAWRALTAVFWQPRERCKIGGQVGVLPSRKRLRNRGHRTRQACTRAKVIQLFVENKPVEPCETGDPGLCAQPFFTMTRRAVLGDDFSALRIAVS